METTATEIIFTPTGKHDRMGFRWFKATKNGKTVKVGPNSTPLKYKASNAEHAAAIHNMYA